MWFQHKLIGEDQLTYIRKFSYMNEKQEKIFMFFSCFNSCDLASIANKDYGFIELRQLRIFDYYNINFNSEKSLHFSIMHHPVMGPRVLDPVPIKTLDNSYISNPVSVLSNRFDICEKLQHNYNVRCLLNGHQHMPYFGVYEIKDVYSKKQIKMNYIVAGSASLNTKNTGMYMGTKNSFNIYTVNSINKISILTCSYDCVDESLLYYKNKLSLK